MEGLGWIALEQPLEMAESPAGGCKQLRRLRRLIADRVLHKGIHPPCTACAVGVVWLPVAGTDDPQGFPFPAAAPALDLPAQVLRDAQNVLHKLIGPLKGGGTHPLEDEPAAAGVLRLGVDHKGVVDMSLTEPEGSNHRRAKIKGRQHFLHHRLSLVHPSASHSRPG